MKQEETVDALPTDDNVREQELAERLRRLQAVMARESLDVCFISNPANFRYLTGIESDFLMSPTRPWFLIVPAEGNPIAVVPELGRGLVESTWSIIDVRTWPSPRPDDEGVTLALEALLEVGGHASAFGSEIGKETRLGMPVADFDRLRRGLPDEWLVRDCGGLLQETRMIKTAREAQRIARACEAASEAFVLLPEFITEGTTEADIARKFMLLGLANGADRCPYIALARGRGGYEPPLLTPRQERIETGDLITIDVGFTVGGYFCDFNRHWLMAAEDGTAQEAYKVLYEATNRGLEAARPGVPVSAVWQAMAPELERHGALTSSARMGHGVGLDITEPPSISNVDSTEIQPGMVLTIEPSLDYGSGKLMVHEEVVLVEETRVRLLTSRAPRDLPRVEWAASGGSLP